MTVFLDLPVSAPAEFANQVQRSSTLPAIPATGFLNYDANDRTATDSYDANGNTTVNSGQTNVYDFENRLVQRGGVSLVYDGDGNRVKETVAGVTTSYLVADQNPTGYAQVVDELQNASVTRTYSYGLQLISQKLAASGSQLSFYGFDGHGSVRFLTDSTGAITDTYDYDAFGNLIAQTGTTPNNYLYAGEQFDPALGIYYNRARYLDQRDGRFWTMDSLDGLEFDPVTLHRYLYVSPNPVNDIDPSGHEDLATVTEAVEIGEELDLALGQTEAATQYLDKAFQASIIVLGTVAAAALLIEGTALINNRTKGEDGKIRRGRIGIQGNDLARQFKRYTQSVNSLSFNLPDLTDGGTFSFSRDTLTWGWTRTWPVLKLEGLAALQAMQAQLGDTSLRCRQTALKKAAAAIQTPGGLPEGYSQEWQGENYSACDGTERVDLKVFKGSAFEK